MRRLPGLDEKMNRFLKTILMLTLMALAPAGAGFAQDQKIKRARENLKESRKVLDESREALELVYLELEEEFNRIHGPYAMQFLKGLDAAWLKLLPEIRSKTERDKALLTSRRRFEEVVVPLMIQSGYQQVLDIDQRILMPFVDHWVEVLYDKLRRRKPIEEGDIETHLTDILSQGVYFHNFWNDRLYQDIPEARKFAQANEDFDKARTDLDRLEHPERYTSRGKLAPSRMVYVAAGLYTVGPNTGWEKARRKVNIREFYIDKYEITNREYYDFLRDQPPKLYNEYVPYFWPMNQNMERVFPEERPNEPVMGVSWKGADAYAKWCGKRLPTEEEWEVAARGKQSYIYPWGNKFDSSLSNTSELGFNDTTEVGSFPKGASPFGCLDMAGNVYEWTATDQDGNRVKKFDNNIRNMVIRGGDYREGADHARADFRWMTPMDPYAGRNPTKKRIGFRCAKDVN
jgi:formylglycine-generating enzyme required for sulfatase activity